VFVYCLTVFLDLNGIGIQDPNGDMFTTKFHWAVSWGNPALEWRRLILIVYRNFKIGSLKWAYRNPISVI
jgi:hypothetical protein